MTLLELGSWPKKWYNCPFILLSDDVLNTSWPPPYFLFLVQYKVPYLSCFPHILPTRHELFFPRDFGCTRHYQFFQGISCYFLLLPCFPLGSLYNPGLFLPSNHISLLVLGLVFPIFWPSCTLSLSLSL